MRVILKIVSTALALIGLGAAPAARATHPLVTDDAGTLGRRAGQIELGAAWSRDRSLQGDAAIDERTGQVTVALGAGLRDDLDLTLGVPLSWWRVAPADEDAAEESGLGDATVELKWRALSAGGFSLAVKPGITLPTGDARRGLGAGRACYAATLALSQELGRFALHANLGYHRDEYARAVDRRASRADRLRASAAAVVQASPRLRLAVDTGLEQPADRAVTAWEAFTLAGAIVTVMEGVDLDAGVQVGISAPATDLTGLLGVTWRF